MQWLKFKNQIDTKDIPNIKTIKIEKVSLEHWKEVSFSNFGDLVFINSLHKEHFGLYHLALAQSYYFFLNPYSNCLCIAEEFTVPKNAPAKRSLWIGWEEEEKPKQEGPKKYFLIHKNNGKQIDLSIGPNQYFRSFRIGRAKDSDIVIDHYSVSKFHAEIKCQEIYFQKSYSIVDEKSTNKTFLNGRPLKPYEDNILNNGDHIQFGADEDNQFAFQAKTAPKKKEKKQVNQWDEFLSRKSNAEIKKQLKHLTAAEKEFQKRTFPEPLIPEPNTIPLSKQMGNSFPNNSLFAVIFTIIIPIRWNAFESPWMV